MAYHVNRHPLYKLDDRTANSIVVIIINFFPIIDPAVWTSLQQRFRRHVVPGVIQDVYDGQAYKKHAAFLANPANISLVCNTDGVALFSSSTVEIWPVWLSINELPRHER